MIKRPIIPQTGIRTQKSRANRHKRKTIKQTSVMASEREDLVFKAEDKRREAKEDRAASDAKRDEARILLTQITVGYNAAIQLWNCFPT